MNQVKVLKEIITIGIFLTLLTPLVMGDQFFFPFVGPKSLYFMGLVEILFGLWLILCIFSKKYRPRTNLLFWSIILFIYFITVSSIFGANLSNSFWSKHERMTGLLMMYHLLIFFLILTSVFKKKREWLWIFSFSVFVAVIVSIISFWPGMIGMLRGARQGATLGNSSFLGSYLIFNIFLSLLLTIKLRKYWKIFPGVGFIIIFISLLMSGARAAFLSTLGGIYLLGLFYLIFKCKKYIKYLGIGLLLISTIIASIAFYLVFQPDSFAREKVNEWFTAGRIVTSKIAWEGWKERPWLGWGLENYELVFAKHFNPCSPVRECGGEMWYDRAHNIIADTGATSGFLGLFSYLFIFLTSFYLLFKKILRKKEFWIPSVLIVILIAYFIQNLTVFDMVSSYMMFFLILAGISVYVSRKDKKIEEEISFNWKKIFLSLIVIGLIGYSLFFFVVQPFQASKYIGKGLNNDNPSERLFWFEKSLKTTPLGKYQVRDFFAMKTLDSVQNMDSYPKEDFQKEVAFVIHELEEGMEECPLDFRTSLSLTKLYALYGFFFDKNFYQKAEENALRSIMLSPSNQNGYWNLSQVNVYQKNFPGALETAEKALELEPRLAQSHLLVIRIAALMKDKELTEEKVNEALELHPYLKEEIEKMIDEIWK